MKLAQIKFFERENMGTGRRLLRLDAFIVWGMLCYFIGIGGWLAWRAIKYIFVYLLTHL